MNVTLNRYINLQNAEVYLKLERKVKRDDIKKYLDGNHFDNERRVKDYLKSIGIYDEQHRLTQYGSRVKETGMVKAWEEGKYQIWFTQNDPLFGNRIFYFKRLQPQRQNGTITPFAILFENDGHYCLPVGQSELFPFRIIEAIKCSAPPQNSQPIFVEWKWKDLESSVYIFTGSIGGNKIADKTELDSPIDLKEEIVKILPEWDSDQERYRIRLAEIPAENLSSFEYSYTGQWQGFNVQIDTLPIEPYNAEKARSWRNELLNRELAKDYLHPADFESTVNDLNQKEGFTAYRTALDTPASKEYLTEITPKKASARAASYWHLAAPLDLNPGIPQKEVRKSFPLMKWETISFRELIENNIWKAPIEKVFYYDKYVYNQQQQKKARALFDAFDASEKYLITDTVNQVKNGPISADSRIKQFDLKSIFKNNEKQHDRYLILSNGAQLEVWNISGSLDFIGFGAGDITADTKGIIMQSVTFFNYEPVESNNLKMLHEELQQFIKGKIQNV